MQKKRKINDDSAVAEENIPGLLKTLEKKCCARCPELSRRLSGSAGTRQKVDVKSDDDENSRLLPEQD